jgi:hypothetical protein
MRKFKVGDSVQCTKRCPKKKAFLGVKKISGLKETYHCGYKLGYVIEDLIYFSTELELVTQNENAKEAEEAEIIVNGQVLTSGQSMTLRVALEGFALNLKEEGLGDDEHGKEMTKLYLDRVSEIRKVLYKT